MKIYPTLNLCSKKNSFQVEISWGTKVSEFTKFVGETMELIVEHVDRYRINYGDLANNDYFKMKFLSSSLIKYTSNGDSKIWVCTMIVEILNYDIWKEIVSLQLRNMSQLVDNVKQKLNFHIELWKWKI